MSFTKEQKSHAWTFLSSHLSKKTLEKFSSTPIFTICPQKSVPTTVWGEAPAFWAAAHATTDGTVTTVSSKIAITHWSTSI